MSQIKRILGHWPGGIEQAQSVLNNGIERTPLREKGR
jgi:hypothetical protein